MKYLSFSLCSLNLWTLHGKPTVSESFPPLAADSLDITPEAGGTRRNKDTVVAGGFFPLSKGFLRAHPGRVRGGDLKSIPLVPLEEWFI